MIGKIGYKLYGLANGAEGRDENSKHLGELIDQSNLGYSERIRKKISEMLDNPKYFNLHYRFCDEKGKRTEQNLLSKLIRAHHFADAEKLVKAGFDPAQFPSQRFVIELVYRPLDTPEQKAAAQSLLRTFAQHGFNMNETDEKGRNALFEAVRYGNAALLETLAEGGADCFHRDHENTSLLHYLMLHRGALDNEAAGECFRFCLSRGLAQQGFSGLLVPEMQRVIELYDFDGATHRLRIGRMASVFEKGTQGARQCLDELAVRHNRSLRNFAADPAGYPFYRRNLTPQDIIGIYTLGELPALCQPKLWHGHEALLLNLSHSVPEHIQAEIWQLAAPLLTAYAARNATQPALFDPAPVIGSWQDKLAQESAAQTEMQTELQHVR